MRRFRCIIIALSLVVNAMFYVKPIQVSSEANCDWPTFSRTPDNNRVALNECKPSSDKLSKQWEYKSTNFFQSSPVYINEKIYVGCSDNKMYCFNALNGSKIWEFATNGDVQSSPCYSDSRIYFGSFDGYFYCLDSVNGEMAWKFQSKGEIQSSAQVYNKTVIFGSNDKNIYCLDSNSGVIVWTYLTQGGVLSSPAILNDNVIIGSSDGFLYCLSAQTGNTVWKYNANMPIQSSPSCWNNNVYIKANDALMVCINGSLGIKIWDFPITGGFDGTTLFPLLSPCVNNGKIYFGSSNNNLYCLDAITGSSVWTFTANGWFNSSPSIVGERLYIGNNDKRLYCVDAIKGKKVWEFNNAGDPIQSSPTIANGRVYVGTNNFRFLCFGVDKDNVGEFNNIDIVLLSPKLELNRDYSNWFAQNDEEKRSFNFEDINIKLPSIEGDLQNAQIIKFESSAKPGSPDIPVFALKIKIPEDEEYSSKDVIFDETKDVEKKELNGSYITPTKIQFRLAVGGKPYIMPDKEEYGIKSSKKLKPFSTILVNSLLRPTTIRPAGGNPYKWPPELYLSKTNELIVYIKPGYYDKDNNAFVYLKHLNLKINTKKKNQPLATNQLKPAFLNIEIPYDMCIVSSSELIGAQDGKMDDFADYANWKTEQGVRTKCISMDEIKSRYKSQGEDYRKLQAFLMDEAKQAHIKYVLLGGENEIVPTSMAYAPIEEFGETCKALIPSDSYYTQSFADWGDVSVGNHKMIGANRENIKFNPELFVGRVPVQNIDELKSFITKMVKYSNYPPAQYYNQRIMLVGKKLNDYDHGGDFLDYEVKDLPSIGQRYIKLYDSQPNTNIGEYINYYNDDFASDVISQRNPHILAFNCHGSPTSLDFLDNSYVDKIKNSVPGYIITSTSCNVNQFCEGFLFDKDNTTIEMSAEPCISEKFLLKDNGGALSYSGNSAYGWYCPGYPEASISSIYQKNFLNELLKLDGFGQAKSVGESFWVSKAMCYGRIAYGASENDVKTYDPFNWWVYNSYNLLGDPSFVPKFCVVKNQIDRLELVPGISQIERESVFTLKAFNKSEQVNIDDPENIEWILRPDGFGKISPCGVNCSVERFKDGQKGYLFAIYKGRQAFADVLPEHDRFRIKITPENAVTTLGKPIQFVAVIVDSEGVQSPGKYTIEWQVDRPEFGSISSEGLFTPSKVGACKVMATCKQLQIGWSANVEILH